MLVVINGRTQGPKMLEAFQHVAEVLKKAGDRLIINRSLYDYLIKEDRKSYHSLRFFDFLSELVELKVDLFISIGGDGTILDTITYASPLNKPVLAINIGRLGFLSTLQETDFELGWELVKAGKSIIQERTLIEVCTEKKIFGELNFGLNEFTITKRDTSSMIKVSVQVNGLWLNDYWADGLIVSTATGSTGYSLSCGGPLVLPEVNGFIITPVSPHNLSARPLIIHEDSEVTLEVEGRAKNFLVSLDSRSEKVKPNVKFTLRKSAHKAQFIRFSTDNHLETLRNKLNWGLDFRN